MRNSNLLKNLFNGLQEEMNAILRANIQNEDHPGTKGDITELCWLEMLQRYLPQRYKAERAFVLDSNGNKSQQIDIVIFDQQYSPFLFKQKGSIYVAAESVYAAIEVKQTLNKQNIEYAGEKVASVRKLFRTNAPIYHAGGCINKPKELFPILGGILCYKSDYQKLSSKAFQKTLNSLNNSNEINFGCALSKGSFLISKNIDEAIINFYDKSIALVMFFLNLLQSLQKLGTAPAIDIEKYAKTLKN